MNSQDEKGGKRNWVQIQCLPNGSQVKAESRRRVDQRAPRVPLAEPTAAVGGTRGSPGTTRTRRPEGLRPRSLKGPGLLGRGRGVREEKYQKSECQGTKTAS